MKIAYVLDSYPTLSETFIAREIEALRRCGFVIEIFALRAGDGAHPVEASGSSTFSRAVRVLERACCGREAAFARMGAQWWHSVGSKFGFDWIHGGFASHPAGIAWGAARAAALPWSFSGHARDIFVDTASLAQKIGAAHFVSVCTRVGQQHLQQLAPAHAGKILYVPHGLGVEEYPFQDVFARPLQANTPRRLLSVGRLVEKKGFLVLLRALSILRSHEYSVQASIVGEGPQRRVLEREIARLELRGIVRLEGSQSHEGVRRQMQRCHCLVVPSVVARDGDRDGLPNVLLEAAACGVPLVASRVGGVSDFLDESTGRLAAPGDAQTLAMLIQQTFEEPEKTHELCRAARRRVEADFDLERNIQLLAQAFRRR
ncbi:MAG TPA: glycosyltransferase family 4 protein [Abditibacteriaceae bacterium]|jgi:glycosyltransferase involved in cell wall biosynthesis